MTEQEMIESVEWLGHFRYFHKIGPYSFVEYHPHVFIGSTSTGKIDFETVCFASFLDGDNLSRSYDTLDRALAGAIAHRCEGCHPVSYTHLTLPTKA